ncbi:hypothetical protein HQ533_02900 [Candidatus Woesearchaeota archaeon]|nr:hypothetical protein [Candidatus Woesearchaeota archaeon]
MATIRRQTAKKCRIKDILEGRYVKREGWEPNYFETSLGKISRANILGVVISADEESITVDDGTGKIQLRTFEKEKPFTKNKVGEIVLIIGKPRVFNEEKYIVTEIVKTIDNKRWVELRSLELKKIDTQPTNKEEIVSEKKEIVTIADDLIKKISELDNGFGVKIEEAIKEFDPIGANKTMNQLIEQGEIFEIKPGIVKII